MLAVWDDSSLWWKRHGNGQLVHHGGEGVVTGDVVSQSSRSVRLLAHIQVDQEAGEGGGDAKVHLVFSFFSFYSF